MVCSEDMIDYSAYLVKRFLIDLLLCLKRSPEEFEAEARLLLAAKLYEMGRVSTGVAARLAGISCVELMVELACLGLSPMGQEPGELTGGLANASKTNAGQLSHLCLTNFDGARLD
jgi:hypothetical protein